MTPNIPEPDIQEIISRALSEDLRTIGDITTTSIFPPDTLAKAIVKSKESGVLSGVYLIEPIFKKLDPTISVTLRALDGDTCKPQTIIAEIQGSIHAILAGERTILNFLQRLSGIATKTHHMAALISHTETKLLDTRKTIPGLRLFEKAAVAHGGGTNHRIGLFDMVLIKDTHVKAAGGPDHAVNCSRAWLTQQKISAKIEVEIQSIEEFKTALTAKPDVIMLDNMSLNDMQICIILRNEKAPEIKLEASGNVSDTTIQKIAETGVDYISSGALTHSAPALDIHLVLVD